MIAMTETTDTVTAERWACAGNRLLNGKLVTAWQEPESGRLIFWGEGQRHYNPGGIYELKISRAADGTFSRRGTPVYTGDRADGDGVAEWEIEDQRARRRDRLSKAEKRHAKDTRLAAAVIPVQQIAASLRDQNQLDALKTYIYAAISEAYWTHTAPPSRGPGGE